MRWSLIVLPLIAALFLACEAKTDKRELREDIESFFRALANDPPTAYTYLAQECKEQISFGEFAASLTLVDNLFGESEPKVENLEIAEREDERLTATFEVVLETDGEDVPLQEEADARPRDFVKEAGRWRLAYCEEFGGEPATDEGATEATPVLETPERSGLEAAQAAEADASPNLPGQYVNLPALYGGPYPDDADHVQRQIDYAADGNSNPPAGGPHWGSGACLGRPSQVEQFCGPAPWGVYTEPWEAETLVHNMEHGDVIVWYNTSDRDVVNDLEELVRERLRAGGRLVMTPYPEMENETIALTAWSRIDTFPASEYSRQRVEAFIDAHERRFNPEGF